MNRTQRQPTAPDAPDALEADEVLEVHDTGKGLCVQITASGREATTLDLPAGAVLILRDLLKEMGAGSTVAAATEITTQQAADLLNVSPPYVMGLIEKRVLPARTVGDERRLPLKDVLIYDAESYAKALEAMEEITAIDQELGLR